MTNKDDFNKDIDIPSSNHACDMCGAYECNGNDCILYQKYEAYKMEIEAYKQTIEKVREACGESLCGDDTRSLILEICDEVISE